MKIFLYTPQVSTRLSYIIDFFEKHISDDKIVLVTDIEVYSNADAAKINYSPAPVAKKEIWVQPAALLFEQGIQSQSINIFTWNGHKVFFKTGGDIAFDIFAASFYLLTRYEEYLPHAKDNYGRYEHTNSLAFKEHFLHQPLINIWIDELQQLLQYLFNYRATQRFTFTPTYDIDISHAYLYQPWWKNLLGFSKDIGTINLSKFRERMRVLYHTHKDPFDNYNWLDELHEKYNLLPCYFFLLAEKRKEYDKNASPQVAQIQQLIKHHSRHYNTGIHPSWQSGDDENILKKEISLLQLITGKTVTSSRQHYIRMTLPATYRTLIENGIKEDYSMGYGSINGFRASVTTAFCWYDIEREVKTALLIRPFCFMEANSFFEQHLTAAQAAAELQQYYDIVKSVNGHFITIFHNHFLTEQKEWLPWRNMYKQFLENNFA